MYENGQVGGFATAEGGNAIARYGVGEAKRHGPLSVRGASAQVKLYMYIQGGPSPCKPGLG